MFCFVAKYFTNRKWTLCTYLNIKHLLYLLLQLMQGGTLTLTGNHCRVAVSIVRMKLKRWPVSPPAVMAQNHKIESSTLYVSSVIYSCCFDQFLMFSKWIFSRCIWQVKKSNPQYCPILFPQIWLWWEDRLCCTLHTGGREREFIGIYKRVYKHILESSWP